MKNSIIYFRDEKCGILVWESRRSGKFYLSTDRYVSEIEPIDDLYGEIADVDIETGHFLVGRWVTINFKEDDDGLEVGWDDNYRAGIEAKQWPDKEETEVLFFDGYHDFAMIKSRKSGRWYLNDQEISPIEMGKGTEILKCCESSVLSGKKVPIKWIGDGDSDDAWDDNVDSGAEIEEEDE